jgi:hypothetical protein
MATSMTASSTHAAISHHTTAVSPADNFNHSDIDLAEPVTTTTPSQQPMTVYSLLDQSILNWQSIQVLVLSLFSL